MEWNCGIFNSFIVGLKTAFNQNNQQGYYLCCNQVMWTFKVQTHPPETSIFTIIGVAVAAYLHRIFSFCPLSPGELIIISVSTFLHQECVSVE